MKMLANDWIKIQLHLKGNMRMIVSKQLVSNKVKVKICISFSDRDPISFSDRNPIHTCIYGIRRCLLLNRMFAKECIEHETYT